MSKTSQALKSKDGTLLRNQPPRGVDAQPQPLHQDSFLLHAVSVSAGLRQSSGLRLGLSPSGLKPDCGLPAALPVVRVRVSVFPA